MQIRTWVMKVASKNALNTLITMVHKRELEEIFVVLVEKDAAVHSSYKKGDVLAILASKGEAVKKSLEKLARPILLDDLPDEMFNQDEEGAELKDVTYPESEDDEVAMIGMLQ